MDQPIPSLKDADVQRIALREFGETLAPIVLLELDAYGRESWHSEPTRVRVAILKLADGNLETLRETVQTALSDCREVLAVAEFPRYDREIGFDEISEEKKRRVIEDDGRQYREWLEGK